MKLAEALIMRSAIMTDLSGLESRINKNLIVQEQQKAQENAEKLIKEYIVLQEKLTKLITSIQKANSINYIVDREDKPTNETLQDALVRRDGLTTLSEKLRGFAGEAVPNMRYSANEIKLESTVDSVRLLKNASDYAQEARELDMLIQKTNWLVEI